MGELNLCAYCVAQSDNQYPTQDTEPKLSGLPRVFSRPLELRDSQAVELGILLWTGSLRPKMALHQLLATPRLCKPPWAPLSLGKLPTGVLIVMAAVWLGPGLGSQRTKV